MVVAIDETSEHSTVEVTSVKEVAVCPLPVAAPTKQSMKRKRVRFNERYNQEHEDTARFQDECHETWYTHEDIVDWRNRRREQIVGSQLLVMKDFGAMAETIIDLYKATTEVGYVMDDASELLHMFSPKSKDLLASIGYPSYEWIGLEAHILPMIKHNILQRRESIRQVVWDIQNEQDDGLWGDEEALTMEIRDSSRNYSQASTLWAQLLALIQLQASFDDEETPVLQAKMA